MRKLSIVCLAFVIAMVFGFDNAYAASAKVTAQCGKVSVVSAKNPHGDWDPIFTTDIHTSQDKELFIDVSLECGLTTNTKVMSKALQRAISEAEAMVEVRVLVDPVYDADGNVENLEQALAEPGPIVFARRYQALIAEFAGSLSIPNGKTWEECLIPDPANPDNTIIDPDCLTEEMLALILDTMSANSFNFVKPNVPVGDHTIVVEARLSYEQIGDQFVDEFGELSKKEIATNAYLGNGSVTVESVRMVKDDNVLE